MLRRPHCDPVATCRNESHARLEIVPILGHRRRQWAGGEVGKGRVEDDRSVRIHGVLQEEEVDVAGEIAEEGKEVGVSGEGLSERTIDARVVPADALERQARCGP